MISSLVLTLVPSLIFSATTELPLTPVPNEFDLENSRAVLHLENQLANNLDRKAINQRFPEENPALRNQEVGPKCGTPPKRPPPPPIDILFRVSQVTTVERWIPIEGNSTVETRMYIEF